MPSRLQKRIPVIDIFAGPGGLGEGFESFRLSKSFHPFKVCLSIEKGIHAHRTLELRSFFRKFVDREVPKEYYEYLQRRKSREDLFKKYSSEAERAALEAWHAELGKTPNQEVDDRIEQAIDSNENWVLIGGPPCQAYSFVGRSRIQGEDRRNHTNNYDKDDRHHLYRQYLRILAIHQPPVFVMENVKGILSSEIKGKKIFTRILSDLKSPVEAVKNISASKNRIKKNVRYEIYSFVRRSRNPSPLTGSEYVIRSEDYGIPQARHRVILLGIRSDLRITPLELSSCGKRNVAEAISDMPKIRSMLSKEPDSAEMWHSVLKSMTNEPWFKSRPKKLREAISEFVQQLNSDLPVGKEFVREKYLKKRIGIEKKWFFDSNLCGYCNHASRAHMREDLKRYFFASCFARVFGRSPRITDFPEDLYPKHQNIQANKEIVFDDRFRVQLPGVPSTTVVSHISQDGHYFIHPDPLQCRSLTVREAARLQTFPDNYFFEGPRTEQYQQVGNAVPPLLAKRIAAIVYRLFRDASDLAL